MLSFRVFKGILIFILILALFILLCKCDNSVPDLREITEDYEQYEEVFLRVAESELFSESGGTCITNRDYDKSNDDLVLIFEQLGYKEIFDFSDNEAYFNKYNSTWDFVGLVYSRTSKSETGITPIYYCKFMDDNKQWQYQNTRARPSRRRFRSS